MGKFIVVTKDTELYALSDGKRVMAVSPDLGEINFMKPETFETVYQDEDKIMITKRRFLDVYEETVSKQRKFLLTLLT